MSEKELRKLYGEDYIPVSEHTKGMLLFDECDWLVQQPQKNNAPLYDFAYAVFGVNKKEVISNG